MNRWNQRKRGIVLGGDLRQVHLANLLSKEMEITVIGLEDSSDLLDAQIKLCAGTGGLEGKPNYIFLPMPVMNGDYISTPFSPNKIHMEDIIKLSSPETIVFGGKIDLPLQNILNEANIQYHDYLKREELAILNAIATAEGTLEIILKELPVTVFGLKVMIVGGGRISRTLRKMLLGLGAEVSVSARKKSDLAWIQADNCKAVPIKDLTEEIQNYDVILNTVPAKILDEAILRSLKQEALLIDLASKPGGVDFDEANRLGIKTIWALSLPGKTAPISSGEIIYQTICNILEEEQHG